MIEEMRANKTIKAVGIWLLIILLATYCVYLFMRRHIYSFSDGEVVSVWWDIENDKYLIIPGYYWGLGKPNNALISCPEGAMVSIYKVDTIGKKWWVRDEGNYREDGVPILLGSEHFQLEYYSDSVSNLWYREVEFSRKFFDLNDGVRLLFIDLNDFTSIKETKEKTD